MKLIKLYLKGFTGIKKGIGIDELTLDLSDLSGLIALSGNNGHGKTTVLENLQPFRRLVSRKKSLNAHVFFRDSVKELTFEMNGDVYRTLIKIDCNSDKQEGFIYKNGCETSEDGVTGKKKEYDAYITKLFGTPELFFNSIFCAQNSEKISDMRTAELKKLFSEFLRLDELIAHEDTAKKCVAILIEGAEKIEKELDALNEKVREKDSLRKEISEQKNTVASKEVELTAIEKELKQINVELEELKSRKTKIEIILQRIKDIEQGKSRTEKDIQDQKVARDNELHSLREDAQTIIDEIKTVNETIADADKITHAVAMTIKCDEDIDRITGEIDEADKQIETVTADVAKQQSVIDQMDEDCTKTLNDVQLNIERVKSSISDCDDEITEVNAEADKLSSDSQLQIAINDLNHYRESAKALETRPDACKDIPDCPAFDSAETAQKLIPEQEEKVHTREKFLHDKRNELQAKKLKAEADKIDLEKELKKAEQVALDIETETGKTLKPLHDELKSREDEKEKLTDWDSPRNKLKKELEFSREEKKSFAELAKKSSSVDVANSKLEGLEKMKTENFDRGLEVKRVWTERIDEKEHQVRCTINEVEDLKKDAGDVWNMDRNIEVKKTAIETTVNKEKELMNTISLLNADITVGEKALTELESVDASMKKLKDKQKMIANELSDWNFLRNACSKDGLRALEIDSVAPVITGYANQLLHGTFGTNYSVKLRTVDPESGREVLDIIVIDEEGNEKLLDVLSGGQKVWSLKALRLAMTLISKEKNDKNFMTALSDEEDGALDPENARHFIRLYREFMKSGGFETCLYITHKPDCVAMADHIIQFNEGGVTIS